MRILSMSADEMSAILLVCAVKHEKSRTHAMQYFKKWMKYVAPSKIKWSGDDLVNCYVNSLQSSSPQSVYGIEFYRHNFGMIDYVEIHKFNLKQVLDKRGSAYDVRNVAAKLNVSIDHAEAIVEERKKKTAGNIENFILRHGDSGAKKYEEFVNKSKSTVENFKIRYGDDWENRWNNFINTRDSSSLSYWVNKLGEKEGTLKFTELQSEFAKSSDVEYYVSEYGTVEGVTRHMNVCLSRGKTSEYYGEFLPESDCFMLRAKKSSVYREFLKECNSVTEAITKYRAFLKTRDFKKPDRKTRTKNKTTLPPKTTHGPVSKKSIELFDMLSIELGRTLQYGKKSNELQLFDDVAVKRHYYDCYDAKTNTIIEFNGMVFHAPDLSSVSEKESWTDAFGNPWHVVRKRDEIKLDCAKRMGYSIIVVWEKDCIGKNRTIAMVNYLKEKINEN